MDLHLLLDNLTNPALLFFFLGIIAVQVKSDLDFMRNNEFIERESWKTSCSQQRRDSLPNFRNSQAARNSYCRCVCLKIHMNLNLNLAQLQREFFSKALKETNVSRHRWLSKRTTAGTLRPTKTRFMCDWRMKLFVLEEPRPRNHT